MSTNLTRRKFLKAVGAGAAWITLTGTLGCEPAGRTSKAKRSANTPPEHAHHPQTAQPKELWTFRTRPEFKPPVIDVITQAHDDTAPGYIFVAPKNGPDERSPAQDGAMILDNSGNLVWFKPLQREDQDVMDFKVQRYRGEDVLTFWEGAHTGYGHGEYVILDSSYREIGRVRAGNGYRGGDHHEFLISPQDTALFTIYGKVGGFDLSSVGGPKEGWVLDGIAQEVDIETGEVLFEWHSLDHVGLDEIYGEPPDDVRTAYDYFHINSIEVDHDNNLLISSRRTSAVYKVDRETGEVIWRLGGKKSDFKMGRGTQFRYQHDARRQSDGTITIFDNGAWKVDDKSYGLVLELDEDEMRATLAREYPHPEGEYSGTQGSMQVLPNENVFIGWGSNPHFCEFTNSGKLLFDASFPPEVESYRAFRFEWSAHPSQEELAVAAERLSGGGDELRLHASWNGATEVSRWRALAGSDPGRLKPVGSAVRRDGFETTIEVRTSEPYVGVRAEDSSGRVLGTSRAIKPGN